MCLAVPVRVVQVDGDMATVDLQGNRKQVSIALVSETKAGDYLLLHAGVALQVLDEEEALETLKLLEELAEAQRQIDDGEEEADPQGVGRLRRRPPPAPDEERR